MTTFLALLAGVVICVIVVVLALKVFGERDDGKEPEKPIIASEEEESPTPSPGKKYVKMPEVRNRRYLERGRREERAEGAGTGIRGGV